MTPDQLDVYFEFRLVFSDCPAVRLSTYYYIYPSGRPNLRIWAQRLWPAERRESRVTRPFGTPGFHPVRGVSVTTTELINIPAEVHRGQAAVDVEYLHSDDRAFLRYLSQTLAVKLLRDMKLNAERAGRVL